jgi:hypothetical protein
LDTIQNAQQLPSIFYGMHMAPGVAEYRPKDAEPYRILLEQDCINSMNQSYKGRPVYVNHVTKVDLPNLQAEADGYVVDSFFNTVDGKTWAKFIAVSDAAHQAIQRGWKLSNAYHPKETTKGGLWHGVEYEKEVLRAEYEHLAIVPDPRYAESIILTEKGFGEYNKTKQEELEKSKVANSIKLKTLGGEKTMFSFFKKTAVDNSDELANLTITLPRSKREVTLGQIINEMDKEPKEEKKNEFPKEEVKSEDKKNAEEPKEAKEKTMANGDHMVKVGDKEMTVNELCDKHKMVMDCFDAMTSGTSPNKTAGAPKLNSEEEEKKKMNEGGKTLGETIGYPTNKQENAEPMGQVVTPSTAKPVPVDGAAKPMQNSMWFDDVKRAPFEKPKMAEISLDMAARGRARYGSR